MNSPASVAHWCHTHVVGSVAPLKLEKASQVMECRRLGHDVRSTPNLSNGVKPKVHARTLRARVESLAIFECCRPTGQRPCLRGAAYQCEPCRTVFRLGDEVGALEQSDRGKLLDAIREVLLCAGGMCGHCIEIFTETLGIDPGARR